jgi:hypothetical protein
MSELTERTACCVKALCGHLDCHFLPVELFVCLRCFTGPIHTGQSARRVGASRRRWRFVAAEMPQPKLPKTSAASIDHSSTLVATFVAQARELAAAPLRSRAQSCRAGPAAEPERFGASLVPGAEGGTAVGLNRRAHLASCAASTCGPPAPRVADKTRRLTPAADSGGLVRQFLARRLLLGWRLRRRRPAAFGSSFVRQAGGPRASAVRGASQAPPAGPPRPPFNPAGPARV